MGPPRGRAAHGGRGQVAEVLRQARERRFQRVTLWVLAGNERARGFYEKAGFTPDGGEKIEERQGFRIPVMRYVKEL